MNIQLLKTDIKNFSVGLWGAAMAIVTVEIILLSTIPVLIPFTTTEARSIWEQEFKDNQEIQAPLNQGETLPQNKDREVAYKTLFTVTAYNSEPAQCSGSPCITANGYNLCTSNTSDTVATNYLPLGTKVRIPRYFGGKVFVVRDRMNKRYSKRIDVWMKNKDEAVKFGIKRAQVEVLK